MAWSISMTAEGWAQVYANLQYMGEHDKEALARALASEAYHDADRANEKECIMPDVVPAKLARFVKPRPNMYDPGLMHYNFDVRRGIPLDREALARIERHAFETFMAMDGDTLADLCLESIERHNTSDNGGFEVWIDREGYHTVPVDLIDGASMEGED